MKKIVILSGLLLYTYFATSQTALPVNWKAYLVRQDSNLVVFNMQIAIENGKTILYVLNAAEKIKVTDVSVTKDSVNFSMPVFESSFKTKRKPDGGLAGVWIKRTGGAYQNWPFFAMPNQSLRFAKKTGKPKYNISGKWDVTITRANGTLRKAVALFNQQHNYLTGTFLTPSGDYRYLEGTVTGDSLQLSTFDGAHAFAFAAKIDNAKAISGVFYSGFNGKETWVAVKNDKIPLPVQDAPTRLREGENKINFSFNDLNGKPVSIDDVRYQNKVVIIQIMGSWCPNCMDETKFLSEYYNKNKRRGLEIIGLAYEYTTDQERSTKSLQKFRQLYNVQYPILITGATAADERKTEKTLPQLTPIRSFPTTIFIDKKGMVRQIKGTFYGPGSGKYHDDFKKEFNAIVDGLLSE